MPTCPEEIKPECNYKLLETWSFFDVKPIFANKKSLAKNKKGWAKMKLHVNY
jgi:hypothetical protein